MNVSVDLAVYPLAVVRRACHAFTDRCYVMLRSGGDNTINIELTPRDDRDDASKLAGEFANALLDYSLRDAIADETRVIRELLVAQAFCEADLLDRSGIEGDEYEDRRGIAG